MTENNNRAVITGLGMICAIGNSVDEAWNNAINSVSGIHKTTTLDTTDCYADLAAEVKCDTLGDFEGRCRPFSTALYQGSWRGNEGRRT